MSAPEHRRSHQPRPEGRPAAERELLETLFEKGIDSTEKARRLFAHGLLREQADLLLADSAKRREARIQGILRRLGEPAVALEDLQLLGRAPSEIASVSLWRRNHFRLLISAAAALLLAFVTLFWLEGNRQHALRELLAMARENHSHGLHVYKGFVKTRRGTQAFDLALAEGGKVQIHIKSKRGNYDFGSTGKIGWFKTPIGKAVEIPLWNLPPLLEALPESLKTLSPSLSYLEVEGLLAKILTEEGMRIAGHDKGVDGQDLVVLEGQYRVLGRSPKRYGRHRRSKGRMAKASTSVQPVYTGTVKIRISPDKGWIHDIRFKDDRRKSETLLERVLSLPDDQKTNRPKWIEFEPEFTKSVPSWRLWGFIGTMIKKSRRNKTPKVNTIKAPRVLESSPEDKNPKPSKTK